jgi:ATP-dependent helicase HrpA
MTTLKPRTPEDIAQRLRNLPQPTYPDDLPVVAMRAEIRRAIDENQVVIICGETGSGKTTQLPKICLELQRGVHGLIGHTQPRRIAARTVARSDSSQSSVA